MDERLTQAVEFAAESDAAYVERIYGLAFRRAPTVAELDESCSRLGSGLISRATMLQEVIASEEFVRVKALDDSVGFARWARSQWQRPRELTAPAGLDERPIEIAWVLSRYRGAAALDIGTANAEPAYVTALLALDGKGVTGVDLAAGDVPGIDIVEGDVRALPFPDGSFGAVLCISTLEHVGADNTVYGIDDQGAGGAAEAFAELSRVLTRDGSLLLTVPVGDEAEHGWFSLRRPERWVELAADAGLEVKEQELYRRGPEGWSAVAELPAGIGYEQSGPGAEAVLCAEFIPGSAMGKLIRRMKQRGRR